MLDKNLFNISYWNIRKFTIFILTIQLAMWSLVLLEEIGFKMHLIRQIIGFFYIIFLPGRIILRILKLHKLCITEVILYSVGLSISFSMFMGLFINALYPLVNINNPISLQHLMIIGIILLILSLICYYIDRDTVVVKSNTTNSIYYLCIPLLFFCVIPFLAIIGAYFVNYYHNNMLLIILLSLVALVVILVGFYDFIPQNLYPFAIFSISLSLLFHNSLISQYISGWDIQVEYYFSNLILQNSIWDPKIPNSANSVLSLTMAAPIFSIILDLDMRWVFKIIFPIIFSFVPIGSYLLFERQTNSKIAFLSTFFFMSLVTYYTDMLQLIRQQVAELYLILIILLIFDLNMEKFKKSLLLVIFTFSIVVSHYGLSYIFMFAIFLYFLINSCFNYVCNKNEINNISLSFVSLYSVFVFAWYIYVSNSFVFNIFVNIINNIFNNLFNDFLNPNAAQGLGMILQKKPSFLHTSSKYLQILFQIFISIGLFASIGDLNYVNGSLSNEIKTSSKFNLKFLFKRLKYLLSNFQTKFSESSNFKFEKAYTIFSIIFYGILIAAVGVPFFASALNASRLYHISLIFLAPYCVIGGLKIVLIFIRYIMKINNPIKISVKILSIVFAIFLLFNCGWIYTVSKDSTQTSISLSNVDYPKFNTKEFFAANWLYCAKIDNTCNTIYSDEYRKLLLLVLFEGEILSNRSILKVFPSSSFILDNNSYIYLGTSNVFNNQLLVIPKKSVVKTYEYINSKNIVHSMNKVYTNGGAVVCKSA